MAISKKKIALIHVGKSRLGLTETDYRKLLRMIGGVDSSKELSNDTFAELMRCFKLLGFESDVARSAYGDRPGMATPPQVLLVRFLWEKFTGRFDERELNHWLEHYFGVSSLRFANHDTIGKALTALKRMVSRKDSDGHA